MDYKVPIKRVAGFQLWESGGGQNGKWKINGKEGQDLLLRGPMSFELFFIAQPSVEKKKSYKQTLYMFIYKLDTCAGIIS